MTAPRTALIAALPREVAALVQGGKPLTGQPPGVYLWSIGSTVIAAAGMGATRAGLAVEAVRTLGPIDTLYSIGLAGACSPQIRVGSVLEATEVLDVHTGERLPTAASTGTPHSLLVTGFSIASVQEKARLHASYAADATDMEAATVARLARAHGIPFRALKAISDDHLFEIANLGRFTTRHGHFHTRAFALHTAIRPHMWQKTMRLGRHSSQALKALTAALKPLIHA